jgi:CheY-like chemotaxis protein
MKSGPIIIVEDDADDKEIFKEVIRDLKVYNEVLWFDNCGDAFYYLKTTNDQPFIIFCDVNLPKRNGLEFKRQLDKDDELRRKSIPFIFYSTSISQEMVNRAYTEMTVQGFFKKHNNYKDIRSTIELILDYWKACRHPNTE